MWPRTLSHKYDQLRDGGSDTHSLSDDSEKNENVIQTAVPSSMTKLHQAREVIFSVTGFLCFWIVLITAWRTTLHPTPHTRYEKQFLTCGNSTVEAEAQDCVFDLLSHNWVPRPCMDWEITAEFREYVRNPDRFWGSWPYFTDNKGKEWIPDEESLAHIGDALVITTQEEHLAHCDFLVRRIHRAAAGITNLDGYIARYAHTIHCINELRDPTVKPLDRLTEGYWVGFSNCQVEVPV